MITPKTICSIDHFKRLIKSFEKIAIKQIKNNPHLKKYAYGEYSHQLMDIFYDPEDFGEFYYLSHRLIDSFGHNQYKTHSCFKKKGGISIPNEMFSKKPENTEEDPFYVWGDIFLSYTIEGENKQRIKNRNFKDQYIAFKIFMKLGNFKKKRIAYWRVKITW